MSIYGYRIDIVRGLFFGMVFWGMFFNLTDIHSQRIRAGQVDDTEGYVDSSIEEILDGDAYYIYEGERFELTPEQVEAVAEERMSVQDVIDIGIVEVDPAGLYVGGVDLYGNPRILTEDDVYTIALAVENQVSNRARLGRLRRNLRDEEQDLVDALKAEKNPDRAYELLREILELKGVMYGKILQVTTLTDLYRRLVEIIRGGIGNVVGYAKKLIVVLTLLMIIIFSYKALLGTEETPIKRVIVRLCVVLALQVWLFNYVEVNLWIQRFFSRPADIVLEANENDLERILEDIRVTDGVADTVSTSYINNPFRPIENFSHGMLYVQLLVGSFSKLDVAEKMIIWFGKLIGFFFLMWGCLTLVLAIVEFWIICLYGTITIPLGILERTRDWTAKGITAIIGCSVKIGMIILLMALFDNAMISTIQEAVIAQGTDDTVTLLEMLASLILTAGLFGALITQAPATARTMLTGNPELSSAHFVAAVAAMGHQIGTIGRVGRGAFQRGTNIGANLAGNIAGARSGGRIGIDSVMSGLGGAMRQGAMQVVNKIAPNAKVSFNEGKASMMSNGQK